MHLYKRISKEMKRTKDKNYIIYHNKINLKNPDIKTTRRIWTQTISTCLQKCGLFRFVEVFFDDIPEPIYHPMFIVISTIVRRVRSEKIFTNMITIRNCSKICLYSVKNLKQYTNQFLTLSFSKFASLIELQVWLKTHRKSETSSVVLSPEINFCNSGPENIPSQSCWMNSRKPWKNARLWSLNWTHILKWAIRWI